MIAAYEYQDIGKNVVIGKGSILTGNRVVVGDGTTIGDGVIIAAEDLEIGAGCNIESGVTYSGYGSGFDKGSGVSFCLGDNVYLGAGLSIATPRFTLGDYSIVHQCTIYGGEDFVGGHNLWLGQDSIANTRRHVIMGHNVRMGAKTQIWTHSASGELIEGSNLFIEKGVTLESDSWLNGGVTVSPGVTVASWSVVLIGSVLTKSTEPYHLYAGVPARDITDKAKPYKPIALKAKVTMMKGFIEAFLVKYPDYASQVSMIDHRVLLRDEERGISLFYLDTKMYEKKRSQIEIDFIKFNLGHNARFVPCS